MKFQKFKYLILLILFCNCSTSLKTSYSRLSSAEKTWVVFHPFKAKKAYRISREAEHVKDSIKVLGLVGIDNNGGQLDAFKHAYWMARLTQGIGKRAAYSLGKAHEKGNYQSFQKRRLEDGFFPDRPSTEMDLYNNEVGTSVGTYFKAFPKDSIVLKIIDSVNSGKMKILAKDSNGNFLDCDGKKIPLDSLKGKWNTKKCLIPSNIEPISVDAIP